MILSVVISFGVIIAVIAGVDFSVFFLTESTEKFLYLGADDTEEATDGVDGVADPVSAKDDVKGAANQQEDDFAQEDDFVQEDFMTDEIALDDVNKGDTMIDVSELAKEFIDDVYGDVYGSST